ncbi:MAG: bifunctional phosphoribosylaminoimidazolecarboxamide formyltransferase/IMP cyclohydrolase [Rectinema sp.]
MPLALISVYDKTGLVPFAQRLARQGWRFLASGGSGAALRGGGIEPMDVAAYTGSPELLGGRVKTLHPAIHAGILARPEAADLEEVRACGFEPIDLVVVNLYPFEETLQRVKTLAEAAGRTARSGGRTAWSDGAPAPSVGGAPAEHAGAELAAGQDSGASAAGGAPIQTAGGGGFGASAAGGAPVQTAGGGGAPAEEPPASSGLGAETGIAEIIEQIDIGGVALIRAAAKNYARVCVLCEPGDYERIALEVEEGGIGLETRRELAAKAFARTAAYDTAIAAWFKDVSGYEVSAGAASKATAPKAPDGTMVERWATEGAASKAVANTAAKGETSTNTFSISAAASGAQLFATGAAGAAHAAAPGVEFSFAGRIERCLRYGENPHQKAVFVLLESECGPQRGGSPQGGCGPLGGRVLGGKELSYNNLLDLDAAWRAVVDFEKPAAVIVKHLSPCGAAEAKSLREAYEAALACDPVSAFGGILALNRPLDAETATALKELFLECIAAPSFDETARDMLRGKKNLRLVEADPLVFTRQARELRTAAGGLLVQEPDRGDPVGTEWRTVSARQPTAAEMEALRFAWKLVQHVKSNAIVLAVGCAAVGIGGGQTNRVDAVRQACERAGERARGAVMASDAFFPFADGIEAAAKAGVTAVVQPGGSVRDAEVLAAADRLGLAMVYTGVRHFRH